MKLSRLFTTVNTKGARNYLNSQKKYEIGRTLLYFGVSLALFVAGYIQTKTRINLLSVVAVLGCLPACKSAVDAIMFLRFHSCSDSAAETILAHSESLDGLFDCVFTSYKTNFKVSHLVVKGKTVCGYSEDKDFNEKEFYAHIGEHLRQDGHKDITVKIFTDLNKYTERLEQMKALEADESKNAAVLATLKSVML